jgi:transcriptional regulator with XRE-family HTH domain
VTTHPLILTLAQLRTKAGMTQQNVADRLCCSRATVAAWEAGHNIPPLPALEAYAAIFGKAITIGEAPLPPGYKRCTRCGDPKPLADFTRDKRRPDGRASHCKDCDAGSALDRYHARRGAVNA